MMMQSGPTVEKMLAFGWRESLWKNVARVLETADEQRRARAIRAKNWVVLLKDIRP